jgi:hypothetical protein
MANRFSTANIDVREFCMEMVDSATTWRASVVGTEPYETNIQRFVTRHPHALPPYVVDVPVSARRACACSVTSHVTQFPQGLFPLVSASKWNYHRTHVR